MAKDYDTNGDGMTFPTIQLPKYLSDINSSLMQSIEVDPKELTATKGRISYKHIGQYETEAVIKLVESWIKK